MRLAALLAWLAVGGVAGAADIVWDGADGDAPPGGWEPHRSSGSQGTLRFEHGELVLRAEPWRFAHLDHALAGMEASDERPLRAQCAIAAEDAAVADGRPTVLALVWGSGAVVAVGVGGDKGTGAARRAWFSVVADGKAETKPSEAAFYPGATPGHVRLVVTTRDISAFASRDGWSWLRVGSIARAGGFAGMPERLAVGRAWAAEPGTGLDHDAAAGKPDLAESRISRLLVSDAPPTVPAELLKSYEKKETLEDTTDAIAAAGEVRQWQIVGPFAPGPKRFGPEDSFDPAKPFDAAGGPVSWKPFTRGDAPTDRIVALSELLPRPGADLARFAQATIVADAPRIERFLFDGAREVAVFLNGRELARERREGGDIAFDRLSVTGQLRQGENHLVVEVLSPANGRSGFTLRHENGDPLYRIALLKRLSADFAGDGERALAAQREIAQLWESLGQRQQAAATLEELAKNPDASREVVDEALVQRARLHLDLRDDARVAAEVDELIKRWGGAGMDPVAGQIKAAQLWERMRQPGRADAAFAEAETAAGDDPERAIEVGYARARVHAARGDQAAVGADLRAAAKRLGERDQRRGELLAAALASDLRAGVAPPADADDLAHASPTVLRALAAAHARQGDAPRRLAALDALAAAVPPTSPDAADVAYAETLLAGKGDMAQAAARYRKAIAALPPRPEATSRLEKAGTDAAGIGALRAAFVYASLGDSAGGRALLDDLPHPSGDAKGGPVDVGAALKRLDEQPEARAETAAAIVAKVDALARADRYPQAAALGRALLRAFPDQPSAQLTAALRLVELARGREEQAPLPTLLMNNGAWKLEPAKVRGDLGTLAEIAPWLDGSPEALAPEREAAVRDARLGIAAALADRMRFEEALAVYGSLLRSGFDVARQVRALHGLGELCRRAGYLRLATEAYATALALDPDPAWNGVLRGALRLARESRGEKPPFDLVPEADAALAAADRTAARGDLPRAVAAYQQALEEHAGQLCHAADGRVAAMATVCEQRLRATGEAGIKAYRDLVEASAQALLARADTDGSADAFERVALAYPLSVSAGTALERAGERYLDSGQWSLAEATFRRRLDIPGLADEARARLQALADRAAAGAKGAHAAATATDPALGAAATLASFTVAPVDRRDLSRFSDGAPFRALCRPAIDRGTAYVATLEDCFAIDLASGALRWRSPADPPALRAAARSSSFVGFPSSEPALVDGLTVSRVVRGRYAVIEARDAASGALRWSSELLAPLAGLSASSSPGAGDGRVYATFVDQGRVLLAAFLAADGRLLWLTPMSSRRAPIPVQGAFDAVADGHAAPPACSGRDVYVAGDLGAVLCVDAGSGAVRWTASYPRAVLGLTDGLAMLPLLRRAPTRVLADAERIYLAPHDHLGVLAFRRAGGDPAWRRELCDCREIVGFAGDHGLLVQGDALELLDVATGGRCWRWEPPAGEGPTLGTAAIGARSAYVATAKGIHRVALATGRGEEFRAWGDLGVAGSPVADLRIAGDALIATTDGQVLRLGGAAVAKPAIVPDGLAVETTPASAEGAPWRIPGQAVMAIDHPPGFPPEQVLVRFDRSLARVDVAKRTVVWRVPIVADARGCLCDRETAIVVHRGFVSAVDLASGRALWTRDVTGHFLLALNESLDGPGVALGEGAVLSWSASDLLALDSRTGARVGSCRVDAPILGAAIRGGHVFTAERLGDRIIVGERELARLGAPLARHETQKVSDRDDAEEIGDGLVVHGTAQATRFDLAAKTAAPFAFPFLVVDAAAEDGRLVATGMAANKTWISAVLDAAGAQTLAKDTLPPGGGWEQRYALREHVWKDRVVRIEPDRQGRNGIAARALADGHELWYVPGAAWSELAYRELALGDDVAVALLTRADGGFAYQAIDLASGKITAAGDAPGWPRDGITPVAFAAGRVVYGTQQGLVALAPGAGAPAAEAEPPIAVPVSASRIAVDAHLDDWTGVPAIALPGGAEIRACSDGDDLCIAASVPVARPSDAAPGASLLAGDCLLLGIDPQDERAPGAATPVVLALALVDGRPQLTVLSGRFAAGADGQAAPPPVVRVARTAAGTVYELALPWAALRAKPDQRPGQRRALRLGAAAITRADDAPAVELGRGLVDGIEPNRWRRLVVAEGAGKAAP